MISSLGLVISTCISSGCGNIASSRVLLETQEEANSIIECARDNYDYSSYNLNYEEGQSLVKQKLYKYSKDNDLLIDDELNELNKTIINDENYYVVDNIDSVFIKENIEINDFELNDNFISNENVTLKLNENLYIQNNLVNIDISRLNEDGSSSSSSSQNYNNNMSFETKSYNEDSIYYSLNGKLNDIRFLGIYCNKDLCVGFYNLVVGWLNNLAINGANQAKGIVATIWGAIQILVTYTVVPGTIISSVITKITNYFISLWNGFISLFKTGGILGIIVATIITIIGVSCLFILISIFIFGYLESGFAVGFLIHHLFWWEWIYDRYE